MTKQTTFEMQVADVFHLEDDRTVFVGAVVSGHTRIKKTDCELFVGGKSFCRFEIEGEMQFTPSHTDDRAVSTIEAVAITSDEVKSNSVVLKGALVESEDAPGD